MLAYLALLCLTVSALAAGPDCNADADKFYKCLKDSAPHPPEKQGGGSEKGSEMREKFEEIEKKRSACFTDKGCKVPTFEGKDGKDGKGPGKEDFAKMKQCAETAIGKVKTCVGSDHFPEPPKDLFPEKGGHGSEKGPGGPEKGPGGPHVNPFAKAGSDCPAATAVNQCLDALKPPQKEGSDKEHGPSGKEGGKEEWEKRRVEMCNKGKEIEQKCVALMTPPCQKSLADTKTKLCDCGTKQKPDFVACIGTDGDKHFDGLFREICKKDGKCEDAPQGGPPPKA
jgi:hypothetical protein